MFCQRCGVDVEKGTKICPNCGYRINGKPVEDFSAESQKEWDDGYESRREQRLKRRKQEQRKATIKKVAAVVGALAVAGGIGAGTIKVSNDQAMRKLDEKKDEIVAVVDLANMEEYNLQKDEIIADWDTLKKEEKESAIVELDLLRAQIADHMDSLIADYRAIDMTSAEDDDVAVYEAALADADAQVDAEEYDKLNATLVKLYDVTEMYADAENDLIVEVKKVDMEKFPVVHLEVSFKDAATKEAPENLTSKYFFLKKMDQNSDYVKKILTTIIQTKDKTVYELEYKADAAEKAEDDMKLQVGYHDRSYAGHCSYDYKGVKKEEEKKEEEKKEEKDKPSGNTSGQTGTNTNTNTNTNSNTNSNTNTQTKPQSNSNTQTKPQSNTNTQSKPQNQSKPESKPQTKPETKPQTKPEENKNKVSSATPEDAIGGYIKNFPTAVTKADISYVAGYMKDGSAIYSDQQSYLTRKDVYEELESYDITDVTYTSDTKATVSTTETYIIKVQEKTKKRMTQTAKYQLEKVGDTWLLTKLVSVEVTSKEEI